MDFNVIYVFFEMLLVESDFIICIVLFIKEIYYKFNVEVFE